MLEKYIPELEEYWNNKQKLGGQDMDTHTELLHHMSKAGEELNLDKDFFDFDQMEKLYLGALSAESFEDYITYIKSFRLKIRNLLESDSDLSHKVILIRQVMGNILFENMLEGFEYISDIPLVPEKKPLVVNREVEELLP